MSSYMKYVCFIADLGRMVTLSPPTSEIGVRIQLTPQVGRLVIACDWFPVYSKKKLD